MRREKRVAFLLEELCTRHGFCLPPLETQRIADNPPGNPDAFAQEVFRVEGLDPQSEPDLYRTVRATIENAFPDVSRS